jgi:GT2 family glycosyltransferase
MLPLSIVTPVFNSAAYLPAALDSIARITVEHEHLVIDGGSPTARSTCCRRGATPRCGGSRSPIGVRPTP